jgi:hypothetical protein
MRSNEVLLRRDFLAPQTCEWLSGYTAKNLARHACSDAVSSFNGRVIHYRHLDMTYQDDRQAARILTAVRLVLAAELTARYRELSLPEKSQLVIWPTGTGQGPHLDKTRSSTTFASVIFLNDNFKGGETFISGHPDVAPQQGSLLVFRGDQVEHGVRVVHAGTRFTLPIWFTNALAEAEPDLPHRNGHQSVEPPLLRGPS